MRGVSDGTIRMLPSTTGLYLDEQSLSYFGGIPDLHMYDIQRIEVLDRTARYPVRREFDVGCRQDHHEQAGSVGLCGRNRP